MQVSISSVKINSFGVEIDGTLTSLGVEKIKSVEKGLNFSLNMKSSKVINALKELYKGDLRTIQNLTEDKSLVENVLHSEGLMNGSGASLNLNVPFLFGAGLSKYNLQTFQKTNGEKINEIAITSLVSREENTRGILSNHKKEVDQFSTTYIDELHDDHRDQFYAANYKWHYEKDDVKAKTLKTKLNELLNQTGIEELGKISFKDNKLGHIRISFDMSLTEYDIFEVIKLLKSSDKRFINILDKSIEATINSQNISDFCHTSNNDQQSSPFSKEQCISEIKTKTTKQMQNIKSRATKTFNLLKDKKQKEATKEFSQIGSQLVKNRFILKEVLNNLFDVTIKVSIEGEKVKRQTLQLR